MTCEHAWQRGTQWRASPRRASRWTRAIFCPTASWTRCCRAMMLAPETEGAATAAAALCRALSHCGQRHSHHRAAQQKWHINCCHFCRARRHCCLTAGCSRNEHQRLTCHTWLLISGRPLCGTVRYAWPRRETVSFMSHQGVVAGSAICPEVECDRRLSPLSSQEVTARTHQNAMLSCECRYRAPSAATPLGSPRPAESSLLPCCNCSLLWNILRSRPSGNSRVPEGRRALRVANELRVDISSNCECRSLG